MTFLNPLECRGTYSATSNDMKLVLAVNGCAVTCRSPPRLLLAVPTVIPTNGQCIPYCCIHGFMHNFGNGGVKELVGSPRGKRTQIFFEHPSFARFGGV